MDHIPKNFGEYLRKLRLALRISPEQVALATNMQPDHIVAIESGIKPVPPLSITPWADILRVNPQMFMVMMVNCSMRKICLQAKLPYLFKVVPVEEEYENPQMPTSFAYQQRGPNEERFK